jgi:hypothetical protein
MGPTILALMFGHALGGPFATRTDAPAPEVQWWAGHQVQLGSRDLPMRGRVTTRTETLVLARVRVGEDSLVLDETACAIRFARVGGVAVSMDAGAIPSHRASWALRDGEYWSRSVVGWGEEDVDGDGHPGMTIAVDAPLCSGEIYVAHKATTRAFASRIAGGLAGRARVLVEQRVLGTSNVCLGMGAKDGTEVVRGPFAYARVPDGSTCASVLENGWPIDAESR